MSSSLPTSAPPAPCPFALATLNSVSCHPEMLDRCLNSEFIYFRAIGSNPRKVAASFHESFPKLSQDFVTPDVFPRESYFSSVLRVSAAGMQLWVHYDVMDNILVQIVGRKRVTLWHPADIPYLYIEGSSSRILDIQDTTTYPLLLKSRPRTIMMEPGDVLYIPALWFHHVESLPDDPSTKLSVAVNISGVHSPPTCTLARICTATQIWSPLRRRKRQCKKLQNCLSHTAPFIFSSCFPSECAMTQTCSVFISKLTNGRVVACSSLPDLPTPSSNHPTRSCLDTSKTD